MYFSRFVLFYYIGRDDCDGNYDSSTKKKSVSITNFKHKYPVTATILIVDLDEVEDVFQEKYPEYDLETIKNDIELNFNVKIKENEDLQKKSFIDDEGFKGDALKSIKNAKFDKLDINSSNLGGVLRINDGEDDTRTDNLINVFQKKTTLKSTSDFIGGCRADEAQSVHEKYMRDDTKGKMKKRRHKKGKGEDRQDESDTKEKKYKLRNKKAKDMLSTFKIRSWFPFILLMIVSVVNVQGLQNWSPDPIIFGRNVTLYCLIPPETDLAHLAFLKGAQGDVLARGLVSSDALKYETSMNKSGDNVIYQLTVINFTESDVNGDYKCTFAFDVLLFNLSIDDQHFVYIPTDQDILATVKIEADVLNVSVTINKVYPEPDCVMLYQGIHFKSNWNTTVRGSILFYEANISFTVDVFDGKCKEQLSLNCMIGSLNYSLFKLEDINCEGYEFESASTFLPIVITMVAVVVVGIIVICSVVVSCKHRRKRKKNRSNEQHTTTDPLLL